MRVGIIGAGPAGMTAAIALRERGIDVLVLEKEPNVGGKCHSLVHGRHAYDLGANLTTPRYTAIRALGTGLGLTLRPIAPRRLRDVSHPEADVEGPLTHASGLAKLLVKGGAEVYLRFRDTTGIDREGYAGLAHGVQRPFREWLEAHGLAKFRDVFANLFVAYGYGVMDELPAAYALKFFDRIHLTAAVDVILGEPIGTTMDFREGFQELWERADAAFGIGVVREAHVREVHRSPNGVRIRFDRRGVTEDARVDALILACPLDRALEFLDASPEEERLFSKVAYYDYFVTAARVRGLPPVSTYVTPYCQRVDPGQPTVFYRPSADDPDDDVFLFYAYGGDGVGVDAVRANLARVVGTFGGTVDELLTTQTWRYFPHVSSAEMTAGFYDDLEGLQGQWHTWMVGEALAFTLVELSARYARDLVTRRFNFP
jgi:predicted NAD/FAD-binding protein